jgi:hypothetical protein
MSEIVLFIKPTLIKERSVLHTNVDDKLIVPEIVAVQDLHMRPLLGSILYDKIVKSISDSTLTGDYLVLLETYLQGAIINYVLSELALTLNAQFWNKGLAAKSTEGSQTLDMSAMYGMHNHYKNRAEDYADRCRKHLIANAAKFPEYFAAGGIDQTQPDKNSYTCPMYLGGRFEQGSRFDPPYNEPLYPYNNP